MRFRRIFRMAGAALILSAALAHAADTDMVTLDLTIGIKPVFRVESATKQAGIIEMAVTPGEQPALDTVRVVIHTNQRRRYRILMDLQQDLMSERGFQLDRILFSVSNGIHGGRSQVSPLEPLSSGSKVVFSNDEGLPDQFTISFFTSSDPNEILAAGNYQAPIDIKGELL